MADDKYAIGLDFGTDSVRALVLDVTTGDVAVPPLSYLFFAKKKVK